MFSRKLHCQRESALLGPRFARASLAFDDQTYLPFALFSFRSFGALGILDGRGVVPLQNEIGDEPMAGQLAYCVKCKEKREMKDAQQVTMKNGKPALQGQCVVCGTKLNLILPASAAKP